MLHLNRSGLSLSCSRAMAKRQSRPRREFVQEGVQDEVRRMPTSLVVEPCTFSCFPLLLLTCALALIQPLTGTHPCSTTKALMPEVRLYSYCQATAGGGVLASRQPPLTSSRNGPNSL